jgi:opacity protein-like surface antigen
MSAMPNRRIVMLLAAALAGAASSSIAAAQFTSATSTTHHWLAIGVGGGEIIPTGNANTDYKSSFQGQLYVVINLGILPELRFTFGQQRFNFQQQLLTSLGYPMATGGYNNVLNGTAGTRIDLIRGPVRPYLTLGVGAYNFKPTIDTTATTGYSGTGTPSLAATTKFGLNAGAGIAIHAGRVEAFVEGLIQDVYTNSGFISSAKQIQAIPVTFGFMYSII